MNEILKLSSKFGPFVFGFVLGYFIFYVHFKLMLKYDPFFKRILKLIEDQEDELLLHRKRILEREALYFGLLRALAEVALQKLGHDALNFIKLYASQK